MKNAHPFKNYIAKRFYHALFKAIQDFYQMPLDTFEIKSLDINDQPELRICFDIIVIASYKNVRSSKAVPTQWFTIKCAGDFANELNDFQILAIEPYQKKMRQVMPHPLPDSLFTMIKK